MKVTKSKLRQIIREVVSAATGTHPGGGVDPNNLRRLIQYFEGSSTLPGLLKFVSGCADGGNCHGLDNVIGDTFGELKDYEGPATPEYRGLYQRMKQLDNLVGPQVKAYLTTDDGKTAIVNLKGAWGAFKSSLDRMGSSTGQRAPEGEQELRSLAEVKKLTKSRIRQIIQEEIAKILSENSFVADLECHELKELMQKHEDSNVRGEWLDQGYANEDGELTQTTFRALKRALKKCT